jgi:hypothetical protein
MSGLLPELAVRGIGAFADGLPDWNALAAFARGEGEKVEGAPKRPAPSMLPANERRRAPDSVLLALQVAQAACEAAGADPAALPSVFASTHGDLAITDAMCATLATAPLDVSPTKFHNSVHNAAAGYWTIGVGCHAPATALSAFGATIAQGLLEAALQISAGEESVLLVGYDSAAGGPLAHTSKSEGLFGLALVLAAAESGPRLRLTLEAGAPSATESPLARTVAGNAMAQAAPLANLLAAGSGTCTLKAGHAQRLNLEWIDG